MKLNGVLWTRTASWGWWLGSGNVIAVVVTAQDGADDEDIHGDGDAGRVMQMRRLSALFAERGDAVAGVCDGDYYVHGVGGEHGVTETTVTATAS